MADKTPTPEEIATKAKADADAQAALDAEEAAKAKAKADAKEAKAAKALPQVSVPELNLPVISEVPLDSEYSGEYINRNDGFPYARAIKKDAVDGKTHFFKNSALFWNGTEAEARETFEKK